MLKHIVLTTMALSSPALAQPYTTDDLAGMGISRGEAGRLADRADQTQADSYAAGHFSGLGISAGAAAAAADRLNRRADCDPGEALAPWDNLERRRRCPGSE